MLIHSMTDVFVTFVAIFSLSMSRKTCAGIYNSIWKSFVLFTTVFLNVEAIDLLQLFFTYF
jgi:hypothetical protein